MNMQIIDLDRPDTMSSEPLAIALGNFDGIHIGHRELLRRTVQLQRREGLCSAVLLFKQHTAHLLAAQESTFLTALEDKYPVLASIGIAKVFLITFSRSFMSMPRQTFLREFLLQRLQVRAMVVGEDYRFGQKAEGDVAFLLAGQKTGAYRVDVIPSVNYGDVKVSSTRIRQAIREGNLNEATAMLGRPYALRGLVGHGRNNGHGLGYPTANLEFSFPYVLPAVGVYLTRVHRTDRSAYFGMTNIGTNPTFTSQNAQPALSVETHLLDWSGNLYGESLSLEFLRRLRGDIRFSGTKELHRQLQSDEQQLRKWSRLYTNL